jgi:cysteine desulfurase
MIYADNAATTPVDPEVLHAMLPFFTTTYGNASSNHAAGLAAAQAVMTSRAAVAKTIGAKLNEIVFTSGATEAINLAILGCAMRHAQYGRSNIVTVRSEHPAVRDAAQQAERHGCTVTWLDVDADGRVEPSALQEAVSNNTLLVSIMVVNNETGVCQDLAPLSAIAHKAGAMFMTDATQAWGKIPLNVDELGIDLMTFSGHKIYAPKGVGALFVRQRKEHSCVLDPMQFGGGQENGLRSGTLNVPGIVALAKAGTMAMECMEADAARIAHLRDVFEHALVERLGVRVNGAAAKRSSTISNITFGPDVDVDLLVLSMPHVAVSKGSACSSAKPKPSPVLTAMGRTPQECSRSLRVSFGRFTTPDDCQNLIDAFLAAHENARLGVTPAAHP